MLLTEIAKFLYFCARRTITRFESVLYGLSHSIFWQASEMTNSEGDCVKNFMYVERERGICERLCGRIFCCLFLTKHYD